MCLAAWWLRSLEINKYLAFKCTTFYHITGLQCHWSQTCLLAPIWLLQAWRPIEYLQSHCGPAPEGSKHLSEPTSLQIWNFGIADCKERQSQMGSNKHNCKAPHCCRAGCCSPITVHPLLMVLRGTCWALGPLVSYTVCEGWTTCWKYQLVAGTPM